MRTVIDIQVYASVLPKHLADFSALDWLNYVGHAR